MAALLVCSSSRVRFQLLLMTSVFLTLTLTSELTPEDAKAILKQHNEYRRQESASNMYQMHWNVSLQERADAWAKRCLFKHERNLDLGENLYFDTDHENQVFLRGMEAWHQEKSKWGYTSQSCTGSCHFTQLVWFYTTTVGCSANVCPSLNVAGRIIKNAMLLVCYYYPRGNFIGNFPYSRGRPCSECAAGDICLEGLCVSSGPISKLTPEFVIDLMPQHPISFDGTGLAFQAFQSLIQKFSRSHNASIRHHQHVQHHHDQYHHQHVQTETRISAGSASHSYTAHHSSQQQQPQEQTITRTGQIFHHTQHHQQHTSQQLQHQQHHYHVQQQQQQQQHQQHREQSQKPDNSLFKETERNRQEIDRQNDQLVEKRLLEEERQRQTELQQRAKLLERQAMLSEERDRYLERWRQHSTEHQRTTPPSPENNRRSLQREDSLKNHIQEPLAQSRLDFEISQRKSVDISRTASSESLHLSGQRQTSVNNLTSWSSGHRSDLLISSGQRAHQRDGRLQDQSNAASQSRNQNDYSVRKTETGSSLSRFDENRAGDSRDRPGLTSRPHPAPGRSFDIGRERPESDTRSRPESIARSGDNPESTLEDLDDVTAGEMEKERNKHLRKKWMFRQQEMRRIMENHRHNEKYVVDAEGRKCVDRNSECVSWAIRCQKSSAVTLSCPLTCGQCGLHLRSTVAPRSSSNDVNSRKQPEERIPERSSTDQPAYQELKETEEIRRQQNPDPGAPAALMAHPGPRVITLGRTTPEHRTDGTDPSRKGKKEPKKAEKAKAKEIQRSRLEDKKKKKVKKDKTQKPAKTKVQRQPNRQARPDLCRDDPKHVTSCKFWAKKGFCLENRLIGNLYCQHSCKLCK